MKNCSNEKTTKQDAKNIVDMFFQETINYAVALCKEEKKEEFKEKGKRLMALPFEIKALTFQEMTSSRDTWFNLLNSFTKIIDKVSALETLSNEHKTLLKKEKKTNPREA